MQSVVTAIRRLVVSDDGQDLLEYGLLGVLIAVVAVTGVSTLGRTMYDIFWKVIADAF